MKPVNEGVRELFQRIVKLSRGYSYKKVNDAYAGFLEKDKGEKHEEGRPENVRRPVNGVLDARRHGFFFYGKVAQAQGNPKKDDHGEAVKKPFQDDGRERGASADSLLFAIQVGADKFARPGRKNVISHEADHEGGKEAVESTFLYRGKQNHPTKAPDNVAEKVNGKGRKNPEGLEMGKGLEHFYPIDVPEKKIKGDADEDETKPSAFLG